MKQFFKDLKLNVSIPAILTILLGIVLILYPGTVPIIVCKVIGMILMVMGAIGIVTGLVSSEKGYLYLAGSIIVFLIGLWFLLRPKTVLSLIPIFMGVLLLIHGIEDFKLAAESKENRYGKWGLVILFGIISVALGLVCIFAAFKVFKISMVIIGIALIYDGISDIWIVSRVGSSAREFRRAYKNSQPIDVDYEEEDIDKR